jgi:hypothetical protein
MTPNHTRARLHFFTLMTANKSTTKDDDEYEQDNEHD